MSENRTVLGQLVQKVAHQVTRHMAQRLRPGRPDVDTSSDRNDGSSHNKLERSSRWLVAEILLVTVLVFFWL